MSNETSKRRRLTFFWILGVLIFYFVSGILIEVANKRGIIGRGAGTRQVLRVIYRPFALTVGAIPGGPEAVEKVTAKLAGK